MVKRDSVDGAELGQVVLVGRVVAVPGRHVEGGEGLHRLKYSPAQLVHHHKVHLPVLVPGHRRLKIPRRRQSVGACAVSLADIMTCFWKMLPTKRCPKAVLIMNCGNVYAIAVHKMQNTRALHVFDK